MNRFAKLMLFIVIALGVKTNLNAQIEFENGYYIDNQGGSSEVSDKEFRMEKYTR